MNWGKLKASDWLKNFPERRLQSDWHFCRGKTSFFLPLTWIENIQTGSQFVLLCFHLCFVYFSACFVSAFDTWFVLTVCFLHNTPSYSTSFVQIWNSFVFPFPRPPSLADWRPFLRLGLVEEWRTFFFFSFWLSSFEKFHRSDWGEILAYKNRPRPRLTFQLHSNNAQP